MCLISIEIGLSETLNWSGQNKIKLYSYEWGSDVFGNHNFICKAVNSLLTHVWLFTKLKCGTDSAIPFFIDNMTICAKPHTLVDMLI